MSTATGPNIGFTTGGANNTPIAAATETPLEVLQAGQRSMFTGVIKLGNHHLARAM